ncbi:MurR/RpiR family transcriptional regulator [Micromonospora sp. H33]|uniref:MurR/RpiR family transcriptional regulator n=1 Tax=Micromonospora sp. H33 TaxID=3452215 RepID=UPI003F891C9B
MGISEMARQLTASLTPAERRALNLLLEEPQEMSKLSAAQVAARLDVHETTVIRLAKRLGYAGYRELRADLARPSLADLTSADRARSRPKSAYTLASLVDDETAAMQRVARVISQDEIDELAGQILRARRCYLFGPPYAQAVLTVLERRLRRFGLDALVLPLSGRLIAEHLITLRPEDLIISFVLRRPDRRLNRINGYANSVGASTAVIADEDGILYDPAPNQLIVAPRGPNANQRSLLVPFLISYALQFALYHLAESSAEEALFLLDDIARVVGDDEPSHGA